MTSDILTDWIGRCEERLDIASPAPLAGLAATLDHDDPPWPAGAVPPLGHWLYFLPKALSRELSGDGHPHRGGFLPPVALPRRMWAGSDIAFHAPIRLGEAIRRHSVIEAVERKNGRTGEMIFVKVAHEIITDAGSAIRERHDIVYRQAPDPSAPAPGETPVLEPAATGLWQRVVTLDPVALFRYSALTFNGHRIHYDRAYCQQVEGYPGLVVHGPLTATLLMDLFLRQRAGRQVTRFRFRARHPLFDIHPLTLHGVPTAAGATLWAADHTGQLAMTAELTVD